MTGGRTGSASDSKDGFGGCGPALIDAARLEADMGGGGAVFRVGEARDLLDFLKVEAPADGGGTENASGPLNLVLHCVAENGVLGGFPKSKV